MTAKQKRDARIEESVWRLWSKIRGSGASLLNSDSYCKLIRKTILEEISVEADQAELAAKTIEELRTDNRTLRRRNKRLEQTLADLLLASMKACDQLAALDNPQALHQRLKEAQERAG